jgi:ankyrin repeat protein
MLLERGADVNIVGGEYGTALRAALAEGHEDIARLLLEYGADPFVQVHGRHSSASAKILIEEFDSALAVAAASGKSSIIQLLLDHGLDMNADGDGCASALWKAATCSNVSVLDFLIKNGADVGRYGGNALREAVYRGRWEHFELLLKHGADVNYVHPSDSHFGLGSALQVSIERKAWDVMHRLLDAGADVNLKSSTVYGTALQVAVDQGAKEAVMELLERGADVNVKAGYCSISSWTTVLTLITNRDTMAPPCKPQ